MPKVTMMAHSSIKQRRSETSCAIAMTAFSTQLCAANFSTYNPHHVQLHLSVIVCFQLPQVKALCSFSTDFCVLKIDSSLKVPGMIEIFQYICHTVVILQYFCQDSWASKKHFETFGTSGRPRSDQDQGVAQPVEVELFAQDTGFSVSFL